MDGTKKLTKGGKGVGRFLWLRAFERVEVESVFENKKRLHKRTFEFRLSKSGVENEQVVAVADTPRKTAVHLLGFKAEHRQHSSCPKAAAIIGRRIVEHFLELFILETCPTIRLRDDQEETEIDLTNLFKTEMRLDVRGRDFQVKGLKFHATHARLLPPQDIPHSLSFCANNRSVRQETLSKHLPHLDAALAEPEGDKKFIYSGYVSGKVLNDSVNPERTRFDLREKDDDMMFAGEVCWQDILETAVAGAKEYLDPFILPLNKAKKDRVKKYVATEAPQYRPLLKHKLERINALRPSLTDEQLDVELYKIGQEWDLEIRAEYRKLLAEEDETVVAQAEFRRRYEHFLEEWNESGVAKLARYVVHRKATLEFLDARRGLKDSGSTTRRTRSTRLSSRSGRPPMTFGLIA